MDQKIFWITVFVVLTLLLAACQQGQSGVQKDVSYVSMDNIKVNDSGGVVPEEGTTIAEATPSEEASAAESETPTPEATSEGTPEPAVTPSKKELVFVVKETDLVKLRPVAYDPDKNVLRFTYTTPLNSSGEWKTTYGDAGQYTVTITASDGELTTSKDALIIVNRKEEPPVINKHDPIGIYVNTTENTRLSFSVNASDLNPDDKLTYVWKFDGKETSTTNKYDLFLDYDSEGSHTMKVDVSDGHTITSLLWSITVRNVNRPPVLKPIADITIKENEIVKITPEAMDPDKEDTLKYSIAWPAGKNVSWDGKSGRWFATYDDSGVYYLNVSVTDVPPAGTQPMSDSQTVKVTVINVNRPPVIDDIMQMK